MPKNIALFIDGTWNIHEIDGGTNVHKLFQSVSVCSDWAYGSKEKDAEDVKIVGATQIAYYLPGVGTAKLGRKNIDGFGGFGTKERIRRAYLFLALNYARGDKVFLFGFSRGAYAVRALAYFVGVFGTMFKDANKEKIANAFRRYIKAGTEDVDKIKERYEIKEEKSIPVRFIGVWDTVRMIGLEPVMRIPSAWTKLLDDPKLPRHISHARHALAIHDLRPEFEPILWEDWNDTQSLQQTWFPGSHGDVGGGYRDESELSDVALRWIACESAVYGLDMDVSKLLPPSNSALSAKVHYETMARPLMVRKKLKGWNELSNKIIESYFVHEIAVNKLIQTVQPKFRHEKKSALWPSLKQTAIMRLDVIIRRDKKYRRRLDEADSHVLALHLHLYFNGKRPLR